MLREDAKLRRSGRGKLLDDSGKSSRAALIKQLGDLKYYAAYDNAMTLVDRNTLLPEEAEQLAEAMRKIAVDKDPKTQTPMTRGNAFAAWITLCETYELHGMERELAAAFKDLVGLTGKEYDQTPSTSFYRSVGRVVPLLYGKMHELGAGDATEWGQTVSSMLYDTAYKLYARIDRKYKSRGIEKYKWEEELWNMNATLKALEEVVAADTEIRQTGTYPPLMDDETRVKAISLIKAVAKERANKFLRASQNAQEAITHWRKKRTPEVIFD